jgi:hypothetical protein
LRRRKTNLEEQVYSNIGKNKGKCSIWKNITKDKEIGRRESRGNDG